MITIRPESDYDCVYVELQDLKSRVKIHIHAHAGSRDLAKHELRQIEVSSTVSTVFAMDNAEEKLPCDPQGLGGSNVFTEHDYKSDLPEEHNEERKEEETSADIHLDAD